MSECRRKSACIILLIMACCMCLIPGFLQPVPDHTAICTASGRAIHLQDSPEFSGTISVNTADAEDLQELPGIGETLAQYILSERLINGDYFYPEDLTAVKGIGMKKLEQFRELLDFSRGGD